MNHSNVKGVDPCAIEHNIRILAPSFCVKLVFDWSSLGAEMVKYLGHSIELHIRYRIPSPETIHRKDINSKQNTRNDFIFVKQMNG